MTTLEDYITQIGEDTETFHEFVNGTSSGYTDTESGPLMTLPEAEDQIQEAIASYTNINPRGEWATATNYEIKDIVYEELDSSSASGPTFYICLYAHTSGTFSTDYSSGYWEIWQNAYGGVITVPTLAALATTKAAYTGQVAYIKGRTSDGDGGQGVWVLTAGDYTTELAADTLNGVYLEYSGEDGSTRAWVRQFDHMNYYVAWFGAVDDGVTDVTDEIKACVSLAGRGKNILFTGWKYLVSDNIELSSAQNFMGVGTLPGSVSLTGGDRSPMIVATGSISPAVATMSATCTVQGLRFLNDGTTGTAIEAGPSTDGFGQTIANCRFMDFTTVDIDANEPDGLWIASCEFGDRAVDINEGSNVHIKDCRFVNSGVTDYFIRSTGVLNNTLVHISNCLFEANPAGFPTDSLVNSIRINSRGVRVSNCVFQVSSSDTTHTAHIYCESGASRPIVENCVNQSLGATGVCAIIDAGAEGAVFYNSWDYDQLTDNGNGTQCYYYNIGNEQYRKYILEEVYYDPANTRASLELNTTDSRLRTSRYQTSNNWIGEGSKGPNYLTLNGNVGVVIQGGTHYGLLTSTEISGLSPNAGDTVFNTTTSKHQGYDGTTWNDFY